MPTAVNVNGAWRDVEDIYVNVNGTWRTVEEVFVNVNGTWRLAFDRVQPMSLAVSDADVLIFSTGGTGYSGEITANVTGGRGPFTYQWTRIAGSSRIFAESPTSRTTRIGGSGQVDVSATFRVRVIDQDSGLTAEAQVQVSYSYVDLGQGGPGPLQ